MDQLKKLWKKIQRWIAADLISQEIGLRLRAMATVFPDFARQLDEAATAAEAERKLALVEADKARKALAAAEAKRLSSEEKSAGVTLLRGK